MTYELRSLVGDPDFHDNILIPKHVLPALVFSYI